MGWSELLRADFSGRLEELGFSEGSIVEAIVTTCTKRELRPNAAPMGVLREGSRLIVRPYVETTTYRNLRENPYAVVNITWRPELFYETAFKEGQCPIKWFTWARAVEAPRLKEADAFIEVEVAEVFDEGPRARFACDVKLVEFKQLSPRAYSRAASATIEAIIWGAKARAFMLKGEDEKARSCLDEIKRHRALVERVDPKSKWLALIDDMLAKLKVESSSSDSG